MMAQLDLLMPIPSFVVKYVFTTIACIWLFHIIRVLFNKWNLASYIKKTFDVPPCHWLYGHIYDVPGPLEPGQEWMLEMASKYPQGFVLATGPFDAMLILTSPTLLREILTRTDDSTVKSNEYRFLRPWLGNGLLTSHGQHWFRHRRLLTKSFHFNILKQHLKVFNETVNIFNEKLSNLATDKKPLKTMQEVALLTLDALLKTNFSYESGCQNSENTGIVEIVHSLNDTFVHRFLQPHLRLDFIFNLTTCGRKFNHSVKEIHRIQNEILQEKKNCLKTGNPKQDHLDFLDTLLLARDEQGNGLTDQEIQDEISTFMAAGYDTTASAITFLFRVIALHPHHQRKIQEEVDGILEGRETDEILWEDIPKLKYLTMCIKESLRMFSLLLSIRTVSQPIMVGGKILPTETTIVLQPFCLHHNPSVWGHDHMEFKPSRFTKENIAKMDPFAFMPFSAGQRNCLGQQFAMNEIKVVAARVFRRFNLTLLEDSRTIYSIVARPETEFIISVEQRGVKLTK